MAQEDDVNLDAPDWDDAAFTEAFNRMLSLRWQVGDHCRAIYQGDDLWYEAEIILIDGDMCAVRFLGYNEEGHSELTCLENSRGKKARRKQRVLAREWLTMIENWRVGDHCGAIYRGDGLWYEAKILAIDGNMCTVDYLGYKEVGEVGLKSLDKSYGKEAVREQMVSARKYLTMISNWRVGDHCTAIYHEDELYYEAVILSINGDMCIVDYLGFDEEDEVKLNSLEESYGKEAIKKQMENAEAYLNELSDDESDSSDHSTKNQSGAHSPHRHYHHHRNNETQMSDHSCNYKAAESTFHKAYPDITTTRMPTAVPSCLEVSQNLSLNAVLNAWYMAGYNAGLHQAQKNASRPHCCQK